MSVYPADGHDRLLDLHFEQLDFISHGALILLTGLSREDQRCD